MSSFFTIPGQKKRKRASAPELPKKKLAPSKNSYSKASTRPNGRPTTKRPGRDDEKNDDDDDEISGSDSEEEGSLDDAPDGEEDDDDLLSEDDSDEEAQTAAERRLKLAEQYLENVKEHVDQAGFDAADIDRDLIAERLQEDVAESKGRVYRQLASHLAFEQAAQTLFRSNTSTVTSIAAHAPYIYTTTKDLFLHKWRIQDLPQHQWPQTTRRKQKKAPAPPKKRPELLTYIKGNAAKAQDKNFQRHTKTILAVAASPDGKYVVTGGEDRKIIVYDSASLKPIKVLMHHRDAVTGLVFRRGTNQLYSSSKDRTVKVWSLDEMAYVETLFGHQDHIVDIDALAQERCVSVGARDRTARLWKVLEETQLVFRGGAASDSKKAPRKPGVDPRSLQQEGSIDRIAMIDEELFVTGSDNGALALWSVTKKKPLHIQPLAHGLDPPLTPQQASAEQNPDPRVVPAPTPRWITALKTVPYSDVILSGSWDGYVRAWRLSEDKKKIEPIGVLAAAGGADPELEAESGSLTNGHSTGGNGRRVNGVINDLAVFERGDRGQEGLCVVAALGKDHRLGRWKPFKSARNGGLVFEVPRTTAAGEDEVNGKENGAHDGSGEEGGAKAS